VFLGGHQSSALLLTKDPNAADDANKFRTQKQPEA
jgi:hypothetical protein